MKLNLKIQRSALFLLIIFSLNSAGQVRLPKLISNGMILQRETPVKIWGWASAGEKVTLNLNQQSFKITTGNDGKWQIILPEQKAGGPFDLEIKASNQIILKDILFGDVWLCSGQSNMETPMSRVAVLYGKEIETCANPNIRLFQVPVRWNFSSPQQDIQGGTWEQANPQSILKYSAVGYFFAHELYEKYQVPVGIIQCAAGGSSAESWISEESLKLFPEQYQIGKQLSDENYLQNLVSTEQSAQRNWFAELATNDLGRKETPWYSAEFDDSDWSDIELPASFTKSGMDFKNGVVWFRKNLELPENLAGKSALLELGRIVDSDSVFINGKFAGTTSYQYPPRRYPVENGILKAGKNNIAVRVVSQSFSGAFIPDKPYLLSVDGQIFDLKGSWKYRIGAKCGPAPSSTFFPGKPLGLFNAMLYPMTNFTLKGMVWYQGESNADRAKEYNSVLTTLIGEWRKLWGQGNLPFIFVQLPDYMQAKSEPSEGSWATLRNQQLKTLSVPNTAMAVTIGLGEWNDIHPLRKKEVGQRCALAAQKIAYGDQNVVASGPAYQSMKISGHKIELTFSDCGSGLINSDGKALKQFAISGADKKYVWANAEIKGNKVIVWSESVPDPLAVRYAWADNPEGANLSNKEGLPASPFTTEP